MLLQVWGLAAALALATLAQGEGASEQQQPPPPKRKREPVHETLLPLANDTVHHVEAAVQSFALGGGDGTDTAAAFAAFGPPVPLPDRRFPSPRADPAGFAAACGGWLGDFAARQRRMRADPARFAPSHVLAVTSPHPSEGLADWAKQCALALGVAASLPRVGVSVAWRGVELRAVLAPGPIPWPLTSIVALNPNIRP